MNTWQTDYVLGTHDAELHRLGLQHSVWRPLSAKLNHTAQFYEPMKRRPQPRVNSDA